MVRFLHTADWQIGMTRHFLQGEAQARFAAARIDLIRRIGSLAQEQQCDFIVVSGDVFDANQLSAQTVGRALEALATVPVPVFLLPGNHDPLDPVTIYGSPQFLRQCPAHVHVLDGAEPVQAADGVQLISAPWRGKHPGEDLVEAACAAALGGMPSPREDDLVRIVVGHGAVDVLDPDRANRAAIALAPLEEHLAAGRIQYVALGDRHSCTQVGDSGAVWYSGTPEVTDHRETRPGEVLVVEVDTAGPPVVTPHRVGTWTFRTLQREVSSGADVTALGEELAAIPDKDRTVLRLALRGVLGLVEHAQLTDLLEEHGAVFAALRLWERHTRVQVTADGADLEELRLGGFLSAAAAEMQELAASAGAEPAADDGDLLEVLEARDADGCEEPPEDAEAQTDPLSWTFEPSDEPDARSAADALTLLYRFSREVAR